MGAAPAPPEVRSHLQGTSSRQFPSKSEERELIIEGYTGVYGEHVHSDGRRLETVGFSNLFTQMGCSFRWYVHSDGKGFSAERGDPGSEQNYDIPQKGGS